jgi:hypothetical protein
MQDPELAVAIFENSLQGHFSLKTATKDAAIIPKNRFPPAALNSVASPLVATFASNSGDNTAANTVATSLIGGFISTGFQIDAE